MEEPSNSVIHQTLHGYADGHTLLAASCDLTPAEKKTLVLLSDLSGQAGNQSFDSYLTGYPLPGKRYYALARTWGAPEMPRPGCVWTQTLLIALPLLTRIRNLSELNFLFKRPQAESESPYSTPISAELFIHDIRKPLRNTTPSFYTIAYYLYSRTKEAIIIPAEGSTDYEEDILNIWSQQWPRLRRAFTFCTGSLSIREIDNKIIDCQVVPQNYSMRLARQHIGDIAVVDFAAKIRNAGWFKTYENIEPQQLQNFFYKYGSDIVGKRSKFAPLCISYAILNNEQKNIISFDILLQFFKHNFNSAKEAKALKRDLINKLIETESSGDFTFIRTLLTSPDTDILPEFEWNFSEQIIKLWSEGRASTDDINKLLEELDINKLSEAQKLELLSGLPVEVWLDISWITDNLLAETITSKPQVLDQPFFWQSHFSKQRIGLEIFIKFKQDKKYNQLKKVVSAMLDAQNEQWTGILSSTFKYFSLLAALDWLLDKPATILPQKWQELVWIYPSEYLFWLTSNQCYTEQTNELMLQIFAEKDLITNELDEKQIKILLTQIIKIKASDRRNQVMAKWLAKGLTNAHSAAKEIIVLLFQPIYNMASQNKLDFASWNIIAPSHERIRDTFNISDFFSISGFISRLNRLLYEYKPQPAEWDRCGQLRQKIIDSCILFQWPSQIICRAISNRDTFERTMRDSLQFESGREFFGKIYRFVQHSKDYKNSFYLKVMNAEYEKTKKGKKNRR